jgi:hypothetical protein
VLRDGLGVGLTYHTDGRVAVEALPDGVPTSAQSMRDRSRSSSRTVGRFDHRAAEDHRAAHRSHVTRWQRGGWVPSRDPVAAGPRVLRQANHHRLGSGANRTRVGGADASPRINRVRGAGRRLERGRDAGHGRAGAASVFWRHVELVDEQDRPSVLLELLRVRDSPTHLAELHVDALVAVGLLSSAGLALSTPPQYCACSAGCGARRHRRDHPTLLSTLLGRRTASHRGLPQPYSLVFFDVSFLCRVPGAVLRARTHTARRNSTGGVHSEQLRTHVKARALG